MKTNSDQDLGPYYRITYKGEGIAQASDQVSSLMGRLKLINPGQHIRREFKAPLPVELEFWFTEIGWNRVGIHCCKEAFQDSYLELGGIRLEINSHFLEEDIFYRDQDQIALYFN